MQCLATVFHSVSALTTLPTSQRQYYFFVYQMGSFLIPHSSTAFLVLLFQNISSCPGKETLLNIRWVSVGKPAFPTLSYGNRKHFWKSNQDGKRFTIHHLLFPILFCITGRTLRLYSQHCYRPKGLKALSTLAELFNEITILTVPVTPKIIPQKIRSHGYCQQNQARKSMLKVQVQAYWEFTKLEQLKSHMNLTRK